MAMHKLSELVEECERGWIDPNGFFWGAVNARHHFLLMQLRGASGPCLFNDDASWILVGEHPGTYVHWNTTNRFAEPNEQQMTMMEKIGLNIEDPSTRAFVPEFRDVYPNGYMEHKLPFTNTGWPKATMTLDHF